MDYASLFFDVLLIVHCSLALNNCQQPLNMLSLLVLVRIWVILIFIIVYVYLYSTDRARYS